LGSFIIGGIAGISPAIKAAKQNPVDALRWLIEKGYFMY
jgi:ABC-type antimicrobial peptide transport system permease subunit